VRGNTSSFDNSTIPNNNNNNNNPDINIDNGDEGSMDTQHSQESSRNQCVIINDPDKFLNVENHQIVIDRGNPKQNNIIKVHGTKTRIHIFSNHPISQDLFRSCYEFLQPNTTYGVYCSNKSMSIKNEILDKLYMAFQNVIEIEFPNIKIKRYFQIVEDVENANEQKEIINNQHLGKTCHRGINDVYYNLRKTCYWPRMLTHITEVVNNCHVCKTIKYDRNSPRPLFNLTPTPNKPFEYLQMDVFFFENRKILTIIDCFSKKLYGYILENMTGQEIIKCLRQYFRNFPAPVQIQCDNAPEFANKGVENFLGYHRTKIYFTTPHHSNSNGLLIDVITL